MGEEKANNVDLNTAAEGSTNSSNTTISASNSNYNKNKTGKNKSSKNTSYKHQLTNNSTRNSSGRTSSARSDGSSSSSGSGSSIVDGGDREAVVLPGTPIASKDEQNEVERQQQRSTDNADEHNDKSPSLNKTLVPTGVSKPGVSSDQQKSVSNNKSKIDHKDSDSVNHSNEEDNKPPFKLRLVPLEKLLRDDHKPLVLTPAKRATRPNQSKRLYRESSSDSSDSEVIQRKVKPRRATARAAANVSVVDLLDSDSASDTSKNAGAAKRCEAAKEEGTKPAKENRTGPVKEKRSASAKAKVAAPTTGKPRRRRRSSSNNSSDSEPISSRKQPAKRRRDQASEPQVRFSSTRPSRAQSPASPLHKKRSSPPPLRASSTRQKSVKRCMVRIQRAHLPPVPAPPPTSRSRCNNSSENPEGSLQKSTENTPNENRTGKLQRVEKSQSVKKPQSTQNEQKSASEEKEKSLNVQNKQKSVSNQKENPRNVENQQNSVTEQKEKPQSKSTEAKRDTKQHSEKKDAATSSDKTAATSKEQTLPTKVPSEGKKRLVNKSEDDTSSDEEQIASMAANDTDNETAAAAATAASSGAESEADAAAKSTDSEVMPVRKRTKRKRGGSSGDDSDFDPKAPHYAEPERDRSKSHKLAAAISSLAQAKKRSRLRKPVSDDDDSDVANERAGRKAKGKRNSNGKGKSEADDSDDDGDEKKRKRKHIRKIIKTRDLDISTKTAAKVEEDRRKRIDERQRMYNQIYEQPESVEVNELVLDFDAETKESLLAVDSGLLAKLKPHQVSGVKFMWDACFETLEDAAEKPGSGCILAHCMGLGKTLQVVTLSHTLLANSRRTHVERVLIISPLSTLNNWAREFKSWMAFARRRRDIEVYDMSKYKDKPTRIFKLNEWFEEGGVCILGYDMYRILANEKAKGLRKKQREVLQQALVEPGPDLVVCDEGHLLKNEKTSISQAVTKMRTLRRIVLTGTPLQNNLKEYYCMIQFIKPNLLGTYKEYMNRFVNPITNGQFTDSTDRDLRLMRHRSHILHKMLEGCIQRRDYSVLAPYLPPKHEYVVYTTLSELQQQLYAYYMTTQREAYAESGIGGGVLGGRGARLFQDFQDLRRIWTHPMSLRVNSDIVIRKRLLADESDSMEDFICDEDDEAEDTASSSSNDDSNDSSKSFASGGGDGDGGGDGKRGSKARKTRNSRRDGSDSDGDDLSAADGGAGVDEKNDPSEWWKRYVSEKELNNIHHSPKLVILMRLLQQCESIGDKLLVFSQSLQSLDVIELFLSLIDQRTKGYDIEGDVGDLKGTWTPGIDYFRLDGSCTVENREAMCKKFNDTKNLRARLFLISTRAGGLGINLVAANRVVIFDVSWNPSHDTQSIFRVYRFGQEKPCYIYRMIAMGTMEQKVYERQVMKQATAKRVIDEQQISRHYNSSDLLELYTYELKPAGERQIPNLPKDRLFAELLTEHEQLLFKYHEHDSLLENDESENMSEEERKAAWSEYEAEKTRSVQTAQYIAYDRSAYGQLGNGNGTGGPATSNKIFGFRTDVLLQLLNMKISKDQPELSTNQVIQLVPTYLERLYSEMNNGDPTMYKELLALHSTLAHPSGMYMSPLLYANQNSSAAGYYQAPGMPPPGQMVGVDGVGMDGGQMMQGPAGGGGLSDGMPGLLVAETGAPAPGFEADKVYEID